MKLCDEIQLELRRFLYNGSDIMIPNYFIGFFECDLFRLTKSDQFYEYEIKTSRSDYFNDFNKVFGGSDKHMQIKSGLRCNRFYFVVPKGMIAKEEVPSHAGLIYYNRAGFPKMEIVKRPKLIHSKTNLVDIRQIASKLSFREQTWRRRFRYEQMKNPDIHHYQKENFLLQKEIDECRKRITQLTWENTALEKEKRKATV